RSIHSFWKILESGVFENERGIRYCHNCHNLSTVVTQVTDTITEHRTSVLKYSTNQRPRRCGVIP
ncbi:MAG: hypothetical protein J7J14_04265, partial [Thermotogaceae bacterium]|nr:hypothetical protein [Thermotogaceae bacterium]